MNNTEKLSPCICLNTPQNKERKVVIHLQLGKKKTQNQQQLVMSKQVVAPACHFT